MFVNFTYQRYFSTCSNNCRGVDPNSIIGAGVAPAVLGGSNITKYINNYIIVIICNIIFILQGIASANFPLIMSVGVGGIAAGAGGSMLMRTSCPGPRCSVNTINFWVHHSVIAHNSILGWGPMLQHSHKQR